MSRRISIEEEWVIREHYSLYGGEYIGIEMGDFGRFIDIGVTWVDEEGLENGYSITLSYKDWAQLLRNYWEGLS